MNRLRILYTIAWMEMGGSQTHLLQVFRLLDRSRFDPRLYCLTGHGALMDKTMELGIPVFDGAMSDGFRPAQVITGAVRLARFMRRERIDMVHNYLLRANIVGSVAARVAGIPVVLSSKRGCHKRQGKELLAVRVANRLSHVITTNADAVREFVHDNEGCPKEKMVVIPSGVDTTRFRPLGFSDYKLRLGVDPHRPVIGIVTRMRVRKGVDEFLRAMIAVRKSFPGTQAVIAGEVELDEELRRLVEEGGLGPDLYLLGRRSDMPEVLSSFDVFVLSSHDEGMSNAILEAMAMELPVVATDVGGTGEVVREGETGLLVAPRDPAPLAAAIAQLLADPERGRVMGRLGRKVVEERFSAAAMVRQMEELYTSMWVKAMGRS